MHRAKGKGVHTSSVGSEQEPCAAGKLQELCTGISGTYLLAFLASHPFPCGLGCPQAVLPCQAVILGVFWHDSYSESKIAHPNCSFKDLRGY